VQNRSWPFLTTLVLGLVLLLSACGDDDDPTGPSTPVQPIAQIDLDAAGGGAVRAATMFGRFRVGGSADGPAIFDRSFIPSEQDSILRIDATTNSEFEAAVELLTNGTNDTASWIREFPGGGGSSNTTSEASFIQGGLSGEYEVDMTGARIEYALLHIDRMRLDIPGDDPNGDGNWTNYEFRLRLVFFGRP